MQHKEIVMSGATIYLAPITTAYPDLDEVPGAGWAKLGTGGDLNMGEEGITVTHEQTLNPKRTLGSTGPVKVTRSEENLMVSGVLIDLTAEQYAKVMNNATVTDTAAGAGTTGHRNFLLHQGNVVATVALLLRGENMSPYGETWAMQYQIPVVYQSENPAPVFSKGESSDLSFQFTALEDAAAPLAPFGIVKIQDAAAV